MNPSQTNPKTLAGSGKVPLHLVPPSFTAMTAVGLLDGELKYGRNNYRETPMEASVLVGAILRHIGLWWEGQTVSSDRGVPHLANLSAGVALLIDMQVHGTLIDDRNPDGHEALDRLFSSLSEVVVSLHEKQAGKDPASRHYTRLSLPGGDAPTSLKK